MVTSSSGRSGASATSRLGSTCSTRCADDSARTKGDAALRRSGTNGGARSGWRTKPQVARWSRPCRPRFRASRPTKSPTLQTERWSTPKAATAMWEAGQVFLPEDRYAQDWESGEPGKTGLDAFLEEHHYFPTKGAHDDTVDPATAAVLYAMQEQTGIEDIADVIDAIW